MGPSLLLSVKLVGAQACFDQRELYPSWGHAGMGAALPATCPARGLWPPSSCLGDQGLCSEAPGVPQPSCQVSSLSQLSSLPLLSLHKPGWQLCPFFCLGVPQGVSALMSWFRVMLGSAVLPAWGSSATSTLGWSRLVGNATHPPGTAAAFASCAMQHDGPNLTGNGCNIPCCWDRAPLAPLR